MMKTCKSCMETLEAEKHFYSAKNMKSGFRNTCKTCENERRRNWRPYHPELDAIVRPAARALHKAGFGIAFIASDLVRTRMAVKQYLESFEY